MSQSCFPHDVEICTGTMQPHCVHHSFVLQQDSSHTLYGIALRVWSRADEKRAETIRELRKRTETDYYEQAGETYWIPYCLSFLSRYPLYNLLGDYLRGMWIHWNKATNLFHAEEVSRILSFPAPRLNDLVRIDMKDYALCYQFPASPTGFQNFAMWPLFSCLSIPNIVGVTEAAISPTRRIIFVSHYPAMLTVAAETIRYMVRVYEWSGLYVPIAHARHVKDLVEEPGPYIIGVTAECRTLFTAPNDALVVDLDRNFVLTSSPPDVLSSGQRTKMINRLTQALNGDVAPSGVPQHLRSAYGGGKLIPAGQIIVMRGEVESVQDPGWWNQDAVMSVMDHACEKLSRNKGLKAMFGSAQKKPLMTKVSMRHLNEIIRERNQYSRDASEAWQDFINLKCRMDTEVVKVTKRNNILDAELDSWKQQFLKFQSFAETLTKETQELKVKIESHKRENRKLAQISEQTKDEVARLSSRLGGTEKQRDDALEALVLQQEIAEELDRERKRNKQEIASLQQTSTAVQRQRDEAQRVVLHLRALIDGQAHHMEHIVRTIELPSDTDEAAATALPVSPSPGSYSSTRDLSSSGRSSRASSRSSSTNNKRNTNERALLSPRGEDAASEALRRNADARRRLSALSMTDVADRQLRDKTDAIAYIIRNISEQCAAAVEGLNMANRAESVLGDRNEHAVGTGTADEASQGFVDGSNSNAKGNGKPKRRSKGGRIMTRASVGDAASEYNGSDVSASSSSYSLHDARSQQIRVSSVPSTPDLVHSHHNNRHSNNTFYNPRSSTAMSTVSSSTVTDRGSMQSTSFHSQWRSTLQEEQIPELPTKILRAGSGESGVDGFEGGDEAEEEEVVVVGSGAGGGKFSGRELEHRPMQMSAP
jgi:hypothetical protein